MVKKVLFPFFALVCLFFLSGYTGVVHADDSNPPLSSASSCTLSYASLFTPITAAPVSSQPILENPKQLAGVSEPPSLVQDTPTVTPSPAPTYEAIIASAAVSTSSAETITDSPTPPSTPNTSSLNADYIFSRINYYRTQVGLPAFEKADAVCQVAQSRTPELYNEIMVNGNMHAGFYARHLPYQATENIIYMRNEDEAVNWWLNSPIHRAAIFGNYKYSCVACSGNACSEIFANI